MQLKRRIKTKKVNKKYGCKQTTHTIGLLENVKQKKKVKVNLYFILSMN